ncbi:MAG: Crp/Fnr family transcriptional regulator [Bacteroidia bacterium]|nr:Crp/Fnr family transcriptional regulator [Bacteroidia bacterium]
MHPFQLYIKSFVNLPLEDWQEIELCLTRSEIPADTLLLEEGQVCSKLYFVEEGLLRFFVWNDGREVNKFFTQAPYCFTSQKSFRKQIPAKENIASIEKCVIWSLPYKDAFGLLRLASWSEFVRLLIQEVQDSTEDILTELQNQTAENRYKQMLEEEPRLLQKVPLKHLASYLGIAPQSLSRIRKKLARS